MSKHPSEMTIGELMSLRAVNTAGGSQTVYSFYADSGALWEVTRGLGEDWVRVYAGYDLDQRTLPYICGHGFRGRQHGLNPPR
jgi:hypothetical protein